MKSLKILALAAVAAAALMAFVGSGTASATILCKVNPAPTGESESTGEECPSESTYPAKTTIEGKLVSGTKAKLVTTFKTIECSKSSVKGETSEEEAEPLTGPEGTVTFEECNCEVKVLKSGTLSTEWIEGSHNGTLKSNKNESTVTCSTIFGNVHCIYVTENTDVGTLTGGNPATLKAEAVIPRLPTNGLCSEQSEWSASYEVTAPKPLFVAGFSSLVKCEKVKKGEGDYTTLRDCRRTRNKEPKEGEWKRNRP